MNFAFADPIKTASEVVKMNNVKRDAVVIPKGRVSAISEFESCSKGLRN